MKIIIKNQLITIFRTSNLKLLIKIFCFYLFLVYPTCINAQETDINGKLLIIHTTGTETEVRLDNDSEQLFSKSNEALINGDNEKAISYLTQLIIRNPNFAQAYCNRGIAYRRIKSYPKALSDFNVAIKINPDLGEAFLSRGLLFTLTNDLTGALEDFNRAISLNGNDSQAFLNRGLVYKKQKNYDAASADYNKAIIINSEFAEAYQNRLILNASLGKHEAAMNDCNKTIELNPNNGYSYYLRANLFYFNFQDKVNACNDWIKSIELGYSKANTEYEKYCK